MPALKIPGGGEVPVPGWCIPWFGVLACAAATWWLYTLIVPPPPSELVSVKQANEKLQADVDAYNTHIIDEPTTTLSDPNGLVFVRTYGDACLLVSQKIGMTSLTRMLIGPESRRRHASLDLRLPDISQAIAPVLKASEVEEQGRCLNPHPGRFGTGYGARLDQCWVEVWRTFDDSCQHVQLLNTCSGAFATNSDGSPRVRWTRCLH